MDNISILRQISVINGGIISTKLAAKRGISKMTLSRLCKSSVIERIAQGQYIFPNEIQDELVSVCIRSDNIIFSHETALFLHGISDRTPFVHSITFPSGRIPSCALREDCKIYYIKPELFDMGTAVLYTPMGNKVPAYDLERTICDITRSRNRMGSETFLAALRMYASRKDKNLNLLYDYAKQLRVQTILRRYLEVLL